MPEIVVTESEKHDGLPAYEQLVLSLQGLSVHESVQRIKAFLTTFPSFAMAHNDLGVLYAQAGNPTLALAHQEKACRLQPDNITFRKNLADFYAVELGWFDDAVDIYLEILKRNPRDTDALISLGKLGSALAGGTALEAPGERRVLMEPPAAAAPKQEAPPAPSAPQPIESPARPQQVTAAPPSARSIEQLHRDARDLTQAGCFGEARRALEELVTLQPANAVAFNDLGVACYNLGEYTAAEANYRKALALDPANGTFARNLADLCFTATGKVDEAIQIYLDLHRKNPRDTETLINLGHICSSVGREEEAKSFFRRALEVEPWNSEARAALAAVRPAPQAPQAAPRRSAAELHDEALRHSSAERHREAHDLLEELVNTYRDFALGYNDLGVVRLRLGNIEGAHAAYRQAVRLQPRNINFRKNLADLCFAELGLIDDAIGLYLDLFREYPRDIETLQALGLISSSVGRPDEAKTFYRRALEIEPWNAAVREALRGL